MTKIRPIRKKIAKGALVNCKDEIPDDPIIIYSELLINFKYQKIVEKKTTIGNVENIKKGAFKNVNLNIIFIEIFLLADFLNCSIRSEKKTKSRKRVNIIKNE